MLKGFRDFILRGNVMDLAVAFIMGAAFNAIVTSLVKDVLTQLIAAIVGKPDFSALVVKVNGTPVMIGNFLNATISFLIVAFVVYFFMVLPLNSLMAKFKGPAPEVPPTTKALPRVPKRHPGRRQALRPLRPTRRLTALLGSAGNCSAVSPDRLSEGLRPSGTSPRVRIPLALPSVQLPQRPRKRIEPNVDGRRQRGHRGQHMARGDMPRHLTHQQRPNRRQPKKAVA